MKIFVELDEQNMVIAWASVQGNANEIEIEIPDDDPFLNDYPFQYMLVNGKLVKSNEYALNLAKSLKNDELNKMCNQTILAGFSHEINGQAYWFSYDYEAQTNFGDAKDALKDGIVSTVPWTVRLGDKNGPYSRIDIDLPTMQGLAVRILEHKSGTISHYRDELMPIVNAVTITTTLEEAIAEVQAVTW